MTKPKRYDYVKALDEVTHLRTIDAYGPAVKRILRRLVREAVTRARYQDGKGNYLLTHERIAKELVP